MKMNPFLYGILGMIFVYLLVSFYSLSFDISLWTSELRGIIAITFFMIGVYTTIGIILGRK